MFKPAASSSTIRSTLALISYFLLNVSCPSPSLLVARLKSRLVARAKVLAEEVVAVAEVAEEVLVVDSVVVEVVVVVVVVDLVVVAEVNSNRKGEC